MVLYQGLLIVDRSWSLLTFLTMPVQRYTVTEYIMDCIYVCAYDLIDVSALCVSITPPTVGMMKYQRGSCISF